MYCSRLSVLQGLLNEEKTKELSDYFSSLIGNTCNNITVFKVAQAIGVSTSSASQILTKCMKEGILKVSYAVRCPKCNMLIKRVESIADIPTESFECYSCDEEVEIASFDVEVIYALVDTSVFIEGQQVNNLPQASAVALENSLREICLAGGLNEHLFKVTDEQYQELSEMYERVKSRRGTTKNIGDTLEELTKKLFNLCPIFKTSGIRTTTNQIDCMVRNKLFMDVGILKHLGGRFFIECKNENETPSGDYLSKLHSIITIANAGTKNECIKFGIIISKERGPKTFKKLAVKSYLSDGIVIISICGDELQELFASKGNLLEMIERKATEIMLDATTDMKEAGLFSS